MRKVLLLFVFLALTSQTWAQSEVDHDYKPLTLKLDDSGKKYVRFIMWHQLWAVGSENASGDFGITPSIRRSRFLAYAQVSPRFLLLTHFGLNSFNANNMTISGVQNNAPGMFLHDAWAEFKAYKDYLYIGGGLHYWNGPNRLANSSTLNLMTLDAPNPFFGWSTLGYSDQFARHLGLYAKGKIGKLDYRLAVNSPLVNSVDAGRSLFATAADTAVLDGSGNLQPVAPTYQTRALLPDQAKIQLQGYVKYELWDAESNKLPYAVGTYLGKKKILNFGAGFLYHPNATIALNQDVSPNEFATTSLADVTSTNDAVTFSADVFYDAPFEEGNADGMSLTAYATYMNFNYGENFVGARASTGQLVYAHAGLLLPKFSDKGRLQPYIGYSWKDYEAFDNSGSQINAGFNWFINGHHAKLTLEYMGTQAPTNDDPTFVNQVRFQAHVFL